MITHFCRESGCLILFKKLNFFNIPKFKHAIDTMTVDQSTKKGFQRNIRKREKQKTQIDVSDTLGTIKTGNT